MNSSILSVSRLTCLISTIIACCLFQTASKSSVMHLEIADFERTVSNLQSEVKEKEESVSNLQQELEHQKNKCASVEKELGTECMCLSICLLRTE